VLTSKVSVKIVEIETPIISWLIAKKIDTKYEIKAIAQRVIIFKQTFPLSVFKQCIGDMWISLKKWLKCTI